MLEGVHFYYDGIYSVDMGLLNCRLDGGMFEESLLPSRSIVEKKVSGRHKPYFQSIELSPLEFNLTFAFEFHYDERRIREVARWLSQTYYKPFYTVDNPNRVFYCMPDGDVNLIHNGLKEGYITLKMRCDGPYSYTPKTLKEKMMFDGTKLTKTIQENTFTNGMGTQQNIEIVNGALQVKSGSTTWLQYTGMKWSDL